MSTVDGTLEDRLLLSIDLINSEVFPALTALPETYDRFTVVEVLIDLQNEATLVGSIAEMPWNVFNMLKDLGCCLSAFQCLLEPSNIDDLPALESVCASADTECSLRKSMFGLLMSNRVLKPLMLDYRAKESSHAKHLAVMLEAEDKIRGDKIPVSEMVELIRKHPEFEKNCREDSCDGFDAAIKHQCRKIVGIVEGVMKDPETKTPQITAQWSAMEEVLGCASSLFPTHSADWMSWKGRMERIRSTWDCQSFSTSLDAGLGEANGCADLASLVGYITEHLMPNLERFLVNVKSTAVQDTTKEASTTLTVKMATYIMRHEAKDGHLDVLVACMRSMTKVNIFLSSAVDYVNEIALHLKAYLKGVTAWEALGSNCAARCLADDAIEEGKRSYPARATLLTVFKSFTEAVGENKLLQHAPFANIDMTVLNDYARQGKKHVDEVNLF